MIRKLRKKFIMITAIALFCMISILIISINVIYIYKSNKNLNHILDIIIENQGELPELNKDDIYKKNLDDNFINNNDFKEKYSGNREMFFTTRFCVVSLDSNKEIVDIYSDKISAISNDDIKEYTEKILNRGKAIGWINDYKYKLVKESEGYMLVILDGSINRQSNWSVFGISILVSTVSYLVILFIIALLSKRAIKPIAESYEKQKQFITDASHELKTPITIISANSQILEMTYGKDEWINGIEKQVEKMRDLVNNLVLLTKMDEENKVIIHKEFNISDAVYDTTMAFQGICKKNEIKLCMDICPNINIKGDEASIRQLISILLDNAVKYCDKEGNIYVTLLKEKQTILRVTNTYSAIKSIDLNRLFDRFYRGDKARTRNGSYGLGLSIAEAIVSNHKGRISAKSIGYKLIRFEVKL